jgi:Tfp pilus assembly PilM family ATPase
MAFLGFVPSPLRVGLELGPQSLTIAWARKRPGGTVEWRFRARVRSKDQSPEALRRDLARLLRPLRRHRLRTHLLLAAPNSYLRWFTVAVPDAKHIPRAVQGELPKLLPFEVHRAQFQFFVRRQQRVGEELECLVSVAACERAPLQRDLEALWQIGWVPTAVVPSALALAQTAKALRAVDKEPVVLVEIGAQRTVMVLMDAGEAVYARDIMLGEDHLIDTLVGQFSVGQGTVSLSRDEAKALVREEGIPEPAAAVPPPAAPDAGPIGGGALIRAQSTVGPMRLPTATYLAMIQPVLEQIASDVRRTMTFGADAATAAVPQRVVISGEGSRILHCDQWLSKQLAVPVVRLNCEALIGREGSAAAVTCGLVLFERPPKLDLQPPWSRRRGRFLRQATLMWQGLAVMALVIWLGIGWWQVRRHAVAGHFTTLQAQWSGLQHLVELQEAVERREQLARRLTAGDAVSLGWFRRLARGFPKPVRLTRLSVDAGGQVSLAGEAQEREQTPEAYVSELTLWLERTNLCEGVRLGLTRRVSANEHLVQFDLTCNLPRP